MDRDTRCPTETRRDYPRELTTEDKSQPPPPTSVPYHRGTTRRPCQRRRDDFWGLSLGQNVGPTNINEGGGTGKSHHYRDIQSIPVSSSVVKGN